MVEKTKIAKIINNIAILIQFNNKKIYISQQKKVRKVSKYQKNLHFTAKKVKSKKVKTNLGPKYSKAPSPLGLILAWGRAFEHFGPKRIQKRFEAKKNECKEEIFLQLKIFFKIFFKPLDFFSLIFFFGQNFSDRLSS